MTNKGGIFEKNTAPGVFNSGMTKYVGENDMYLRQMSYLIDQEKA